MIYKVWGLLCQPFLRRHALRLSLLILLSFLSTPLLSEIPVAGVDLPLGQAGERYRLDSVEHEWQLLVRAGPLTSPIKHSLGDCRFCASESVGDVSDNCQMDGVFPLLIDQRSHVGVICHVGAHSQRLMLFDLYGTTPTKVITGSYFVTLALGREGLLVVYDDWEDAVESVEKSEIIADSNSLNVGERLLELNEVPRPLRIGPSKYAPIVGWLENEAVQQFNGSFMPGWLRVMRRNNQQGYLLRDELPESNDQE